VPVSSVEAGKQKPRRKGGKNEAAQATGDGDGERTRLAIWKRLAPNAMRTPNSELR
jgi:hypothetical protein